MQFLWIGNQSRTEWSSAWLRLYSTCFIKPNRYQSGHSRGALLEEERHELTMVLCNLPTGRYEIGGEAEKTHTKTRSPVLNCTSVSSKRAHKHLPKSQRRRTEETAAVSVFLWCIPTAHQCRGQPGSSEQANQWPVDSSCECQEKGSSSGDPKQLFLT